MVLVRILDINAGGELRKALMILEEPKHHAHQGVPLQFGGAAGFQEDVLTRFKSLEAV